MTVSYLALTQSVAILFPSHQQTIPQGIWIVARLSDS